MPRGRRTRALLAAAALAGGLLGFAVATVLFPYHTIDHDESVYLQQAALLLRGRLFLHPPVAGAFRPWFFVRDARGLYAKYAPYPAVLYAAGTALGNARLALAVTGGAFVAGVAAVGAELRDRYAGALAAVFVLCSPLFVVQAGTFLPYVPVAALNVWFAYAYLRSERTKRTRWAALAGALVGCAFFARPYTAVLFAAPFVAHACWTLWRDVRAGGSRVADASSGASAARRLVATAALGLVGVALALAYNRYLTGSALVFPYQAFAPADGLGFGPHAIRGYGHDYTPVVALRANAVVVRRLFSRWVAGGFLGSALAAVGCWRVLRRGRDADTRVLALAGLYPSVVLGNVYFWGNYNLLSPDFDPAAGLLSYLGPTYHVGLLLPTAVFAAVGLRWLARVARPRLAALDRRAAVACVLAVAVVSTAAVGGALAGPVSRNARVTDQYARGYAPFENGTPADSVVFVPPAYGDWLNHPFQLLRNDPGYDGRTLYALDGVRSLAVTAAYPNRTYYRYEYRGTWNPTDRVPVHPALRRVRVTTGGTVTETLRVRLPRGTDSASVRVASGGAHGYYALNATPGEHALTFAVNDTAVRVGGVDPAGSGTRRALPVNASDDVTATIYVQTAPSVGFSYRSRLPVGYRNGSRAALTPSLEACTDARTCGGGAAFLPDEVSGRYRVNATVTGT